MAAVSITHTRYADVSVVRPEGQITNEVAPQFQVAVDEAMADGAGRLLVLDFGGLDYVSSGGLRVVASGARRCRESGGQLAVAALTTVVDEIFSISRFNQVVPVHPTVAAALASLSPAAAADHAARAKG